MQRPPDRKSPPILFARPTHEWINRVDQKHEQLAERQLSTEQKNQIAEWVETEFVYSTLKLEGVDVSRERVSRFVSASLNSETLTGDDLMVVALLESLRTVESLARDAGRAASLTPDLLLRLHNVPGSADSLRKSAGDTRRSPKPVPPEHLPAAVEGACRWYTAESFGELNPIEQASIVLLRLIEMQPFEQMNEQTALLAASLFTLRSGLPPIIMRVEMHSAYRAALEEGSQMNTKPMVELLAQALEKSISEMIGRTS